MHHLEQARIRKRSGGGWLSLLKDSRKGGGSTSTSAAEPPSGSAENHHAGPAGEDIPEEARTKPNRTSSGGLLDWKGKGKKEKARSYALDKSESAPPAVSIEVSTARVDYVSPVSPSSSISGSSIPSSIPSSSSLSSSSRSTSARSAIDGSVRDSLVTDRFASDDDSPLALQTADSMRSHRKAKEGSLKQHDGSSLVPQLRLRMDPPTSSLDGSDRTSGASSRTSSCSSDGGGSTTSSSGRQGGSSGATSAITSTSSSRGSIGGGGNVTDRIRDRVSNRQLRVVSLLGAATEVVATLGLEHLLVGRSHECKFPASVAALPCVTSPALGEDLERQSCGVVHERLSERVRKGLSRYYVDVEAIKRLQPDVIITQDACDVCAVTLSDLEAACSEYFRERGEAGRPCHVASLKPITVSDVWDNMIQVAAAVGHREKGCVLVQTLKARWSLVRRRVPLRGSAPRARVVCLQWLHPLMGAGYWVPEIVACAGGKSLSGKPGERTAMLTLEALLSLDPDVIIAMCCGLSMEAVLREFLNLDDLPLWNRLRAVQTDSVFVADGDRYFNNSGPSVVESAEIMVEILHARRFPHHRTASNRAGGSDGAVSALGRAGAEFPEIEIKYEGKAYAQLTGGCVGSWRALLGDGGGLAGRNWGRLDAGKPAEAGIKGCESGGKGGAACGAESGEGWFAQLASEAAAKGVREAAREAAKEAALAVKAAGKLQLAQAQRNEEGGNLVTPLPLPPGYTGGVSSASRGSSAGIEPADATVSPLPSPPGRSSKRPLWGLMRGKGETDAEEGAAGREVEEERRRKDKAEAEERERAEQERREQERIEEQFLAEAKQVQESQQLQQQQVLAAEIEDEQTLADAQQALLQQQEQQQEEDEEAAFSPSPGLSLTGAALKAAQLRALFLATIETSLPADCLLLSGGLASTVIAHAATSLIWPGSIAAAITVLASPRAADRLPAAAAARACVLGGGGGGGGGHVVVGGGPGFQPEHLLETELRFVVRVLKSFDPAEIRMGVVLAAGLREAKRQGFCSVLVGDGADELFTAFDFMVRMSEAKLHECRQHMVDVLRFPCRDLAQALGLEVRQPFLHPALQEFALGLSKDELLGEGRSEEWGDFSDGNLLLRMAFPEVVSARRPKDPIEAGAGTMALTRHFARKMSREEFQVERQRVKREDQVRIRDPEHLHYYRAFQQVFGGPQLPGVQRWQPTACSACGFPPLFPDQLLCATCGECSTRKPSRRRNNPTNAGGREGGAAGDAAREGDGSSNFSSSGSSGESRSRLSDVPRSPRRPATPPRSSSPSLASSSASSSGSNSGSSGRKQRGCWGGASGGGGAGAREAFGGRIEECEEEGEWGREEVVVVEVEVAEEVCAALSVVNQALAGVASPDRALPVRHSEPLCTFSGTSNSSVNSSGSSADMGKSSQINPSSTTIHSLLFSSYSHPPSATALHHSDSLLSLVACVDGGLSVWGDFIGSSQCREEPEGDSDDSGRGNSEGKERERARSEGRERRGGSGRRGRRGRRGSLDGSDREDSDGVMGAEGGEAWSVTDATTEVAGFSESDDWGEGEEGEGMHEGLSSTGSFSDCASSFSGRDGGVEVQGGGMVGGGEKSIVLGGDGWSDAGHGGGRFSAKEAEAANNYKVHVAETGAKPTFQHHQVSSAPAFY